jgi:hypothetical protein
MRAAFSGLFRPFPGLFRQQTGNRSLSEGLARSGFDAHAVCSGTTVGSGCQADHYTRVEL